MADGSQNALAQMPPWAWGLLLLGSGGGLGAFSGLSMESHDQCAPAGDLARAQADLAAAQAAVGAANATIQSLIGVLKDNQNQGWIE